jgi:NADPH:quinone reductase-like Zn-dependent oxidoreductase
MKLFILQEDTAAAAKYIADGAEQGWLAPVIAHEYTLTDAPQAHHDIIKNAGAKGKLVIKP